MKDDLRSVTQGLSNFSGFNSADKIIFFAWYLHHHRKQDRFSSKEIAACFELLDINFPSSNLSPYMKSMETSKPPRFLKDKLGYRLEHKVRQKMDSKYGERAITIEVSKLLETLPSKVPNHNEREFLQEALTCYRRGAFRAAIVMTWNLAYWHLCQHVLIHKLSAFNASYPQRLAGKWKNAKVQTISSYDDFSVDLQEAEMLDVCKHAVIVTNDIYKILTHGLGKRNSAAHPSSVKIEQLQAESLIDDLVKNVVLKLSL